MFTERKQILYVLVFVFMGVVAYQIYITSTDTTSGQNAQTKQCNDALSQMVEMTNQQMKKVNEMSKLLFSMQEDPRNGVTAKRTAAPDTPYGDHYAAQAIELEARVNTTKKRLPNTCFPLSSKTVCLPNFIIIGAMKAGTTFLDYYIQKHPLIAKHSKKEIWFFNAYYSKGIEWYADHFEPVYSIDNQKVIGEATPFYVNNPHTPARMYMTLKNARLIMMMRDPVDRALSQYYFSLKWIERNQVNAPNIMPPPDFDIMIREEADVIQTCLRDTEDYKRQMDERKMDEMNGKDISGLPDLANPFYQMHSEKNWTFYRECQRCDRCFQNGNILHTSGHPSFGMLAKNLYYEQINLWLDYFPLEQILFIRYEDLEERPEKVMRDVEDFLGLPQYDYGEFVPKNAVPHDPMSSGMRQYLTDYFREHNEKLYKLLNRDFGWAR
eukprot:gene12636-14842_t